MESKPVDLPPHIKIPESYRKKMDRFLKLREERQKQRQAQIKRDKIARKGMAERAMAYEMERNKKEASEANQKKQARLNGNFYVPAEPKLAFVVRIRGINGVSPQVRKILQLLRLRQIHNGVFVKINKASLGLLKRVEPYIAWGYPNLKTIRMLMYKRGYGKVNGQRIPITSNQVIQSRLSHHGVQCMEDLIHEIITVGPEFRRANNFMWPFKLTNPRGGYSQKGRHFCEGGDHGNRENEINKFVQRMI
eukprot:gnl/Trimastix_PCT/131.p4 GENE.gnl/Trimastix_PCT/131~~gnl/Trimastix_PCT/131.p4  ORF type:complete len:249 (+),score=106.80 gnl/Trimastix_PCT/131:1340-2086(+)